MRLLPLLFAGVAAVLLGANASAEPVKIRTSWVAPVTNWASILLEKKDLAKHLGQSYVLEPQRFAGTPPMITAIANNELEVSNLAYSTLAIAIENAGLDDLRVIADEFRDGVPGYYPQEYMVLADSPIKKVEDLKGKVVMTNAAGSAVDVAMRAMLRKFGLEDKRDYTMVEGPFPAIVSWSPYGKTSGTSRIYTMMRMLVGVDQHHARRQRQRHQLLQRVEWHQLHVRDQQQRGRSGSSMESARRWTGNT